MNIRALLPYCGVTLAALVVFPGCASTPTPSPRRPARNAAHSTAGGEFAAEMGMLQEQSEQIIAEVQKRNSKGRDQIMPTDKLTGRIKLSGTRKAIDGTFESVNVTVDPAGWFFFRGSSELTRSTPKNETIATESFDYDGGDVWLHRENKKWIHGKMERRIRWDNTQETGTGKQKISGHTIERDKNLDERLIDSGRK